VTKVRVTAPRGRVSTLFPAQRVFDFLEEHARPILLAPALIAAVVIIAFPIVYTLWISLQDWFLASATGPKFIGLENYRRLLFDDTRFHSAMIKTFYFTVLAIVLQVVIGVGAALIFNREFWGRGILRTLYILPMVATPVAISLIWIMMLHPTLGVINYLLRVLHLPPTLSIYAANTVIPALVIVDTWQWVPLIMLITLGGLATLPTEPYEAAMIDGANAFQTFWLITLPLLRPVIVVAILFRSIDALKTYDIIYVMTQGGPGSASETINIYLFLESFQYYHMGYASSVVVIFFAIILGISLLLIKVRRTTWL